MIATNLLTSLGLNDKEARAYLAILELGRSTVTPIAQRAKIKRTSVYNFIGRLVALGIVSKLKIRGRQYFEACSPTRLLEIQRERLADLERELPALQAAYNSSAGRAKIHYYEGASEVRNIVRQEIECKKEALYIWPGKDIMRMIGGLDHMAAIDRERIRKKVWVRSIRFRQKDIRFPTSANGQKYLRELRFAPAHFDFSMGLGIYDTGRVGFFSSERESFGILIESRELELLMRSLYELLWKNCLPAQEGEG